MQCKWVVDVVPKITLPTVAVDPNVDPFIRTCCRRGFVDRLQGNDLPTERKRTDGKE